MIIIYKATTTGIFTMSEDRDPDEGAAKCLQ